MKLGISGAITRSFIRSKLTPLLIIAALLSGLLALSSIPREDDPQIKAPIVDVSITANGLKAANAAELVTKPLETILKSIPGVKHIYSQTQDDQIMVGAEFHIGTPEQDAVIRVRNHIQANIQKLPIGIPAPLIVGHGINDVATVVMTLTPKPGAAKYYTEADLSRIARKVQTALIRIPDIGLSYIVGNIPDEIRIEPDPAKLSLYGVTFQQLVARITEANKSFNPGNLFAHGKLDAVIVGHSLQPGANIGLLQLTTRAGRPVYVDDVATIVTGPAPTTHKVFMLQRTGKNGWRTTPAVSIAFAKRSGSNAVVIAQSIRSRLASLQGRLIPQDVAVTITRDDGRGANAKVNDLLLHLALATLSIVVLISVAIGWRAAAVTAVIIPTTVLLTIFASWVFGFSINRVSLFALIFSIGILVDDAIVVIENISRHWDMNDTRTRMQAAIEAVAEVGNPTIIATLTVITALLPMLFVSGLMGPYMAPIPINASTAMVMSFFMATIAAPWMLLKLAPRAVNPHTTHHDPRNRLGELYWRVAEPVIRTRRRALAFLLLVGIATLAAISMFYFESVTVKLLPYGNKSHLTVVLDLPAGASRESTERNLLALAQRAATLRDVKSVTLYAGTAGPFDFNGLVRGYYARQSPNQGELHILLTPRDQRSALTNSIAEQLRAVLRPVALPSGATMQIVQAPPGPPVLAPLVAEIYGPTAALRRAEAKEIKTLFSQIPYITDIHDSWGYRRPQLEIDVDQSKLNFYAVNQSDVNQTIADLLGGVSVGYAYRGAQHLPMNITVGLPNRARSWNDRLAATPIQAASVPGAKAIVELGQVVTARQTNGSTTLYRRDGQYSDMVEADMAGKFQAPIYAILAVDHLIADHHWTKNLPRPTISLSDPPLNATTPTIRWSGEWRITYVTFRDMGGAFIVALLGIYVLVVGQFRSFKIPLMILTPVPLTLIGIMLGHWLLNAYFTATSMIGFIALAGIIVRNSILLVDFIRHGQDGSTPLRRVLLEAGAIRAKPILLTAVAAMIGAAAILPDPIFQGLGISLLFGLASSTLLTLLVIPAIYVVLRDDGKLITER
ncbi:MAG TPA: efflux RND transporter permease subunit [Acidiphilium sp.]|nr:MAG: multidrug transporter AcrB [Acidiphilium sp. 21-60-14]OYV90576.1 MAG: multidrug transporter AcrB [Acidiphilium sp. 37-60-79]OZB41500.1 MAG: multidrug transporter AcrB [Acidiphilium sp. 34-60-192]HQT87609.1 efflux RND transporter permease subunit [Acidiphilium sp.]HQU24160.1 efflux RND transporter permease subunit [Acidiphilium sp.]